jgi:polysaccharide biosynthesis/export protein
MKISLALVLVLAVAGCSGPEKSPGGSRERTPDEMAHPGGQTPPTLPPAAINPLGTEPLPASTHFSAPRDPILMPGDVLDISVYGEPDLALSIRLPESGTFTFPLIGVVEANGLTTNSLEAGIRDRLGKDYLHNPQVTVTVTSFAPRQVFILGGVSKPSGYELPPSERMTLLQLISTAGGITDKAYKEFVQVVRVGPKGEREVLRLSLIEVENAIASGNPEADIELQPLDLVMIPSAARVVYVLGAVNQPGWFDIPADTRMTASMAISRAGSFTKFASTSSIQVLRQTPGSPAQKLRVDLDAIVGGNLQADVVLQPGDVVWVPERGLF